MQAHFVFMMNRLSYSHEQILKKIVTHVGSRNINVGTMYNNARVSASLILLRITESKGHDNFGWQSAAAHKKCA